MTRAFPESCRRGILYISYSGMLEPLGQSQVLAYQERIAEDRPVYLLSFERADDWARVHEREAISKRMAVAGIIWHPLRYHKRFSVLATAWDILRGTWRAWRLVRKHDLAIVHARSYICSVMALAIKRLTGAAYLFDMRGFWADERVDGGLWPAGGRMYRVAKWFERIFLLNADHVVSLTHAAVREMQTFPYLQERMPAMTVIPTCADLNKFRPGGRPDPGFVLGYVGSAGTWYLFDEVVVAFNRLRQIRPDSKLLIINRREHRWILDHLAAAGVPAEAVEIHSASHAEVPGLMARMHAGIFFIKPVFSKLASAPTKLGEFLGCGVPCLSNSGVGDMAEILEGERVGVAVEGFEADTLDAALRRLVALVEDPAIRARCVSAARKHFSLEEGTSRYRQVYASTLEGRP